MTTIADFLRPIGIRNSHGGQDTIPAFINKREAAILRALGGSGRKDPETGMTHFDEGDNTSSSSMESDDGGWDSGYVSDSDAIAGLGQQDGATSAYEGPAPGEPGNMAGGWNWSEGRFNSQEEQDAIDAANSKAGNEAWQNTFGYDPTVGWGDKGGLGEKLGFVEDKDTRNMREEQRSAVPDSNKSFLEHSRDWISAHPNIVAGVNTALSYLNPTVGIVATGLSNAAQGKNSLAAANALSLVNPTAGRIATAGIELADKGPQGLLSTAIQAGAKSVGIDGGNLARGLVGDQGPVTQTVATVAGDMAGKAGADQIASYAPSTWSGVADALSAGDIVGPESTSLMSSSDYSYGGGVGGGGAAPASAYQFSTGGGESTSFDAEKRRRIRDIAALTDYSPASMLSKYLDPETVKKLQEAGYA
jgi:hypothetical protein